MRIFEIEGYPEYQLYYSDEEQKVFSKKSGKYLKNCLTNDGYYYVHLYNDKGAKNWKIHRLVWYVFNGEIPEGLEINHINEIKIDNRIENLNLMTHKENVNYGTRNQRCSEKMIGKFLNHKDLSKAVVGVNKQTYDIIEFPSIREAMRFNKKFDKAHISACCKHKTSKQNKKKLTVNGYYWFYKQEFNELLNKFNGNIQSIIEYKISLY